MTSETTRPTTTAGELTVGQHILYATSERVYRVEHTYRHDSRVLLYLDPLDGGEPLSRIWFPSMAVPLVTDDELTAREAAAHRAAVVAALRELADDIEDLALPVPRYGLNVSAAVWTYAEAEAWAEYLGVEVRAGGTQKDIPVADREGDALAVHVQSQEPMPDAISLDVAAGGDRAEAVQAEVDALTALDEHIANPTAEQPRKADDGRCPACKHEAEHLIFSGCVARPGGQLGMGKCGCKHTAAPTPTADAQAGE